MRCSDEFEARRGLQIYWEYKISAKYDSERILKRSIFEKLWQKLQCLHLLTHTINARKKNEKDNNKYLHESFEQQTQNTRSLMDDGVSRGFSEDRFLSFG